MADDADRAQETQERMEQLHQLRLSRRQIQRASDFCVDCGELIEAIRLRALPTAIRCTYCQTDHERIEKQYAR